MILQYLFFTNSETVENSIGLRRVDKSLSFSFSFSSKGDHTKEIHYEAIMIGGNGFA